MLKTSAQFIRETFTMDEDGRLIWNTRPRSHWSPKPSGHQSQMTFNTRNAGKFVGVDYTIPEAVVSVSGVKLPLEQIIYLLAHGDYEGEVIFKNGRANDYRPENLVAVTHEQAMRYWSQVNTPKPIRHLPLDLEDLFDLIDYVPATGRFFWNRRDAKWFDGDEKKAAKFNREAVGQECFAQPAKHGGFVGSVMGRKFTREKLVWIFEKQELPSGIVVHQDGDTTNCRIGNLIDVPVEQAPEVYKILNANLSEEH